MNALERLDAYAAHGLQLYLDASSALRVRCAPEFRHVLDAARPSLRVHRQALADALGALGEQARARRAAA